MVSLPFNDEAVRTLAAILTETGLTEIEIEGKEGRIRVVRAPAVAQATVHAAPPPPAFQAFDVRAFGILLQELAAVTRGRAARVLAREGARAAGGGPADRPSFAELEAGLRAEAARAGVVEV